jgi:hypothetical protein
MSALRNFGIAALAAVAAAGCGDDEEKGVPNQESRALRQSLGDVKRALAGPDCDALSDELVPAVEIQVQNLPDDVGADVRDTIEDGVAELRQLVAEECAEATEPETDTQPEPTPEPAPEPPPAPPPTQPEPEPEPEEPDDEGPPPPQDEGKGNEGNGNGNGSGGTSPGRGERGKREKSE